MSAAAPSQATPAEHAPPRVGASPVATLVAAQRPSREAAALMGPVWHGEGVADGRRLPVMLVPGFLAGDPSLSLLNDGPNVDHLAINPLVAQQVRLVAALGSADVPGMFRDDCLEGDCAHKLAEWPAQPFPVHVPYVSVYSRSDWVVDWRACVDPDADNVEIDSSHVGMSVHPRIYELLGERLAATAERVPSELGAAG